MTRLLGETAQAVAVIVVLALFVGFLTEAAEALRPPHPDDGLRREPPAQVGARVWIDGLGEGVITHELAYGDGPMWRIRLAASGKHVVLSRAKFKVLGGLQ